MKIGILFIGIGKYSVFFKDFYQTCEKYFLPNLEKVYYVFSDQELNEYRKFSNIKIIKEKDYGWPGNTLYRFHMFKKIESEIKKNDFIFFFNSNYKFINYINESEILKENILINLYWSRVNKVSKYKYKYERNPKSEAFINFNEGKFYYQGGMIGGKTQLYLKLIDDCIEMIEKDKKIKYTPLYNDESYLNKYYLNKEVYPLNEIYGMPEEWGITSETKAILQDKNKILGTENIKNQKKELFKIKKRIKNRLVEKYRYFIFKITQYCGSLSNSVGDKNK